MTTESQTRPTLEPAIESLLAGLRKRIRTYVWIEGIAVVLVLLAASFWMSLTFDWIFEPPLALRIAILSAVGLLLLAAVFSYLVRRLFVRLPNRNMAVLIERKFFERFHDSLLTTVELSERPLSSEFSSEMFANTQREALAGTAGVDLGKVFDRPRLKRRVALALLLLLSVLAFGVAASPAFAIWMRRSLLLSPELWPRKTFLVVEGFKENVPTKMARGGDLGLSVKADASPGKEVPETVEVRLMTSDRRREKMNREGVAVEGRDEFQNYSYKFKSVLEPFEFYVVGGDARRGPFQVEVVDSPSINEMVLHCEYPAYMHRAPRDILVSGVMHLPLGTEITIRAQANKDLSQVQIDELVGETTPLTTRLQISRGVGGTGRSFQFRLPTLQADKKLSFTLSDTDDIRSREPVYLSLVAVADEPPQVGVQLKGIGSAITAKARLPASGDISDDYGVAKVWFEFRVDDAAPQQRPIRLAKETDKLAVAEALEVQELGLQPKQKFHLAVQAADNYALASEPHVGTSPRYALDVVTPEGLRSMLDSRELTLRRRFEVIIQEFTETRDLLAQIDFGKAAPVEAKDPDDVKRPRAASESRSPERLLALRRVQTERVLQNSERSAHETLAVAVAFDEIREELINNRIDTEELKARLQDGISNPLKRIVEKRFSRLEERLKRIVASLNDPAAAQPEQALARDEADVILVEMRQVLDKMLELETFNEALNFCEIIKAQEEVRERTKEKSKKIFED